MDDVSDRSTVPPPLPPKTRKNTNNQVIATVVPPSTKATVFGGVDGTDEIFSFSFPEVRSLNLQSAPHSITSGEHHVVKIRINPGEDVPSQYPATFQQFSGVGKREAQSVTAHPPSFTTSSTQGCIRISVGNSDIEQGEDMVRRTGSQNTSSSPSSIPASFIKSSPSDRPSPYFFYGSFPSNPMVISSGQSSPSDTLDSGTCSDLDGSTPPPLPKKKSVTPAATVTVTVNGGGHRRTGSLTSSGAEVDSDDDGSNISCDSLNSSELNGTSSIPEKVTFKDVDQISAIKKPEKILEIPEIPIAPSLPITVKSTSSPPTGQSLPQGLLRDIRDRTAKLTIVQSPCDTLTKKTRTWADDIPSGSISPKTESDDKPACVVKIKDDKELVSDDSASLITPHEDRVIVEERTYEERQKDRLQVEAVNDVLCFDRFYKFHLNEHVMESKDDGATKIVDDEETFAGYRDLLQGKESSTIRSAKGTVRGVKNRVRAGIATFLQNHAAKNYKKEEEGKVVVYTTTMGVVRETYQECVLVKKILRNLMIKYEERDVFMSRETQSEIRERMGSEHILVPQVFVEGQHIGDADTIERLNETGELRRILKAFKSPDACSTCRVCGGHRLLPCSICNGSKKSVHRNEFTAEFVTLKCMHCDEVGLVRCHAC